MMSASLVLVLLLTLKLIYIVIMVVKHDSAIVIIIEFNEL